MTKFILIIIAVIGVLAFAYFTRIDGYHERIEQFSTYLPINRPIKFIQMKKVLKFLIFILKWDYQDQLNSLFSNYAMVLSSELLMYQIVSVTLLSWKVSSQFSSYLPLNRPNSLNPQMFYTRNTKPHFN